MKKWSRISIRWFMPGKKRMPVIVMMPKKREMGIMKRKNGRKKDKKQQKADNVYLKGQTSGFDIKV